MWKECERLHKTAPARGLVLPNTFSQGQAEICPANLRTYSRCMNAVACFLLTCPSGVPCAARNIDTKGPTNHCCEHAVKMAADRSTVQVDSVAYTSGFIGLKGCTGFFSTTRACSAGATGVADAAPPAFDDANLAGHCRAAGARMGSAVHTCCTHPSFIACRKMLGIYVFMKLNG